MTRTYLGELGNGISGAVGGGSGAFAESTLPIVVASNVVTTAGGVAYSLFVTADGVLWAMGFNMYGQLGNGTTADTSRPVAVASNVVAVAADYSHSLFVTADGTLWAMGYNDVGQLGNGTIPGTDQPIAVASNVTAVAAGNGHSLYVTADGALWAMGYNGFGELGNGTTVTYNTAPVLVNGGGLVTASLAKGCEAYHALAIAGAVPVVNALTNQTICAGQPVSFIASLSGGDGPFTYQWQLNGTNLVGATNITYTIASAALSDAGNYSVVVTGLYGGTTSGAAMLTVDQLAGNPTNIIFSVSGNTVVFSWPADHLGWILQAQTNSLSSGLSTNWFDLPGTGAGISAVITIDPANGAVFYRLRHP